jgi:hypothetical protein
MVITLPKVLLFIAFACGLLAALSFASVVDIGPAWAWLAGGFAAWWLAQAVS